VPAYPGCPGKEAVKQVRLMLDGTETVQVTLLRRTPPSSS